MIKDFTRYPREFITYRWFRPILTGALFYAFHFIFEVISLIIISFMVDGGLQAIMDIANGGYDTFDAYTILGVIITLGEVALMIPALALANLIAGGRTFKSYESSRGGWNYGIFFKCLLIALIVVAIPIAVDDIFFAGRMGPVRFTLPGIILLTIIGPMQCIAEEYIFRGLLMQTFGSWFRFPPLAIVLSAAVFAALHPYNKIGVAEIFISGCIFGLVAWMGHGIEVSSALHIANNMAIFYCVGFGYGQISSQETIEDLIFSVTLYVIYAVIIFICKKRGMFEKAKRNDAAEWNSKVQAKRAMKTAPQQYIEFPDSQEGQERSEVKR